LEAECRREKKRKKDNGEEEENNESGLNHVLEPCEYSGSECTDCNVPSITSPFHISGSHWKPEN